MEPEELLVKLSLGRVREPPFDAGAISERTKAVTAELESRGLHLGRMAGDRKDVAHRLPLLGVCFSFCGGDVTLFSDASFIVCQAR